MKKKTLLPIITASCLLLSGCGAPGKNMPDITDTSENEDYIYSKTDIPCPQMNSIMSGVSCISDGKIYSAGYGYTDSNYSFANISDGKLIQTDMGINIPMSGLSFSNDMIFVTSLGNEENSVTAFDKDGTEKFSVTQSVTDAVYNVGNDSTGKIYLLRFSYSDMKSFADTYDKNGNKLDTYDLNKIAGLSEDAMYMFMGLTIDKENNIFTVGLEVNFNDASTGSAKLYKFSPEFEKLSETDLTELGNEPSSLFINSDGNIVVAGYDGSACRVNIMDSSCKTLKRYDIPDIEYVFGGPDSTLIYQKDDAIFEFSPDGKDKKISDLNGRIVDTSPSGEMICTSGYSDSPVIIISDTDGNEIETINTNIDTAGYVSGICARDEAVYLLISDYQTGGTSLYSYENGKENTFIIDTENTDWSESDAFYVSDDSTAYFSNGDTLICYNINTGEKNSISEPGTEINGLCADKNGEIKVLCQKDEKLSVYALDNGKNKLSKLIDTNIEADYPTGIFCGNGKYSVTVLNGSSLCGIDEDFTKAGRILNFGEADVNDMLSTVSLINDDKILCVDKNNKVFNIDRTIDPKGKTIINVVGFGTANSVTDYISKNLKDPQYKIVFKDYKDDEKDKDNGISQFNLDIASGKTPDILISKSVVSTDMYEKNGLLEDLSPYIEKDSEINKDDYMNCTFGVNSSDGKIYKLSPQFSLVSVIAKKADTDDKPWTYDDLFNYKGKAESLFYSEKYDDILQYLLSVSGNEFADINAGTADFNNEKFMSLLRFCRDNGVKEEENDDKYIRFRENKCSLEIRSISGFNYYNITEKGIVGEEIALKGISPDGKSNTAITHSYTLSIMKNSEHKEEAWNIIRRFLLDEFQNNIAEQEISIGFPVKRSALEKSLHTSQNLKDEFSKKWSVNDKLINIGVIGDDKAEMLLDTINNSSTEYSMDAKIISIVKTEAAAYFENSASEKETAEAIQNKVSLYLKERQ